MAVKFEQRQEGSVGLMVAVQNVKTKAAQKLQSLAACAGPMEVVRGVKFKDVIVLDIKEMMAFVVSIKLPAQNELRFRNRNRQHRIWILYYSTFYKK
jgi:hypothetical protein